MNAPTQQQRPTAEQVARCLVKIANQEQERIMPQGDKYFPKEELSAEGITHLKLQKLLYFAQATSLAVNGEILFPEKIEAWELGPVVPSVYRVFANYRNNPIPATEGVCSVDADTESFLREVWKTFGKYTASQLVDMTHRHDPWKRAMQRTEKVIDPVEMETFYERFFTRSDAAQGVPS